MPSIGEPSIKRAFHSSPANSLRGINNIIYLDNIQRPNRNPSFVTLPWYTTSVFLQSQFLLYSRRARIKSRKHWYRRNAREWVVAFATRSESAAVVQLCSTLRIGFTVTVIIAAAGRPFSAPAVSLSHSCYFTNCHFPTRGDCSALWRL